MSDNLALVDTNIFVYAYYEESEHHIAALKLLDQAQIGQVALCISPQTIAEFYAVITDRRRVTSPYQPDEALDIIDEILAIPEMNLLPIPTDIVNRWLALVRRHPVTRSDIFDVQLAATMLGNGVTKIYTFDRSHFERFDEIEVLTPS